MINVFRSSIDSIAQENLQTINKIVEEAKSISQYGVSLESQKAEKTNNVEINMVLESLRRIAEHSGDIAEASINMNVKI
jgi:PhoU domain.